MDEHVKPNFDCKTLRSQEINISEKSEDIRLYKKKIWVVGHQGMVGQALIRKINPKLINASVNGFGSWIAIATFEDVINNIENNKVKIWE